MAIQPDAEKIKRHFGLISSAYDRANDVMTAGLLRQWRARLVALSGTSLGLDVLDTATGTGDLAVLFKLYVGSTGTVIGLDFCSEMLGITAARSLESHLHGLLQDGAAAHWRCDIGPSRTLPMFAAVIFNLSIRQSISRLDAPDRQVSRHLL